MPELIHFECSVHLPSEVVPGQLWVVPTVTLSLLQGPQPGGRSLAPADDGDGRLQVSRSLLVQQESFFVLESHLIAYCQVQLEGRGGHGGRREEGTVEEKETEGENGGLKSTTQD